MRLGDLDALKEVIRDNPYLMKNLNDDNFECILDLIDNAPTVEVMPTELHEKIMDKTTGELLECQSNLRPQGEWIDIDSLVSKAMCSNCKNIIITEPFGKPNFCPNCGADMKEKPNQLRDCENCIHHSENGCEVWECEFKKRSDL